MSTERFALPGFMTPGSPNWDERIYANPDGSIRLTLGESVPLSQQMPDFEVLISTEYGEETYLQAAALSGQVIEVRDEHAGTKHFDLRLGPPCITMEPGNYTLRAMVNSKPVFFRHLVVPAHPIRQRLDETPQVPPCETV